MGPIHKLWRKWSVVNAALISYRDLSLSALQVFPTRVGSWPNPHRRDNAERPGTNPFNLYDLGDSDEEKSFMTLTPGGSLK
jgi:hypothetical protein